MGEECNAQIKIVGSRNELWIDGEKQYNQWIAIRTEVPDIIWMYFDKDGKTLTYWQQLDGNWYYFGSGGSALGGGWRRMEGEYYYFDPETRVLKTSGTEKRDGITYEFSADGRSVKVDGLKSAGEDGKMYSGGHFIDGYFYLFDGLGRVMVGGHTYYRGTKYVSEGQRHPDRNDAW